MGDSTQGDTKTTTQVLTPDQQRLASLASGQYDAFAASNPTLPTGDQAVAPFDPLQTAGQNQVLGAVPGQTNVVNTAAKTNADISGGEFLDPGSNPYVTNAVNAAVDPVYQELNRKTLPGIAANASTGSGGVSANFGGSRQGVIEANAINDANRVAANTGAAIENSALQNGINATNTAIAQAPTTAASLTVPGATTSTVGEVRQNQAQNVLDANNAAAQLAQWLPAIKAQLLTQGAAGLPGGSTQSVGTGNVSANPVSQVIGGAAAAGGLAGGLSKLLPLLAL